MNYTEEMNLNSKSGFCMPFEDQGGRVTMSLGYGEQKHPTTGEAFFHHGVDFETHYYVLNALADGKVVALGNSDTHGLYLIMQYGGYRVKYGHLSSVSVSFGQTLKAGRMVGISGDLLHLGVRFGEQEINPIEFITMLYSNMKTFGMTQGTDGEMEFVTLESEEKNGYEAYQKELEKLMIRYFPSYMAEISRGSYRVPLRTEQSLRNVFALAEEKQLFFESIPTLANPLGIGRRSSLIAAKVQNLLISDFLEYLAFRQQIFLSGLTDIEKKK